MIGWAWPARGWLLIPWGFLVWAVLRRQHPALSWLVGRVSPKALDTLSRYARVSPRRHLVWIGLQGAVLIAASAGPYVTEVGDVEVQSRDIVLLVDASMSMGVPDASPHPMNGTPFPSRLHKAKAFATDLVALHPSDRIGLISFSGHSVIHAPLTTDHRAVTNQVNALKNHELTQASGSEFGLGFATIIHLARRPDAAVQVVLLSDGDITPSERSYDTELAVLARLGIPIHTVAFGSAAGRTMSIWDPADVMNGVQDKRLALSYTSRRDAQSMQAIGRATGGTSVVAERVWADELSERIAALPGGRSAVRRPVQHDKTPWLVFLFAVMFLAETEYMNRRAPAVVAAALIASGCTSDRFLAYRLTEEGRHAHAAEDYTEAASKFEQAAALDVKPHIPTYNLGLTLHATGQLAQAHTAMEQAIALDPSFAHAFYGDGVVLYEWGEVELDEEACRYERTRELWNMSISRFESAISRCWFTEDLGKAAAQDHGFLQQRLAWLEELAESCQSSGEEEDPPESGERDDDREPEENRGGEDEREAPNPPPLTTEERKQVGEALQRIRESTAGADDWRQSREGQRRPDTEGGGGVPILW